MVDVACAMGAVRRLIWEKPIAVFPCRGVVRQGARQTRHHEASSTSRESPLPLLANSPSIIEACK